MTYLRISSLALVLLLFAGSSASADPTALDSSFGGDGRVLSPLPALSPNAPTVYRYTVDSLGRPLTVATGEGEHPLTFRYLPDGSPDRGFGAGGFVSFPNEARAEDVAVDSQGRIIVVGVDESNRSSFIARLREDGSFDRSFGEDGILFVRKPKYAFVVAVDSLDRILVAGVGANGPALGIGGAVARYLPSGGEDPSFSMPPEIQSRVKDLTIDGAGRILIGGSTRVTPSESAPQVRRLLPDGSLDPSFGPRGERLLPKERFAGNKRGAVGAVSVNGLSLDSRGRILLSVATGGPPINSRGSGFAVARLHSDGRLDASFGSKGRVLYAMTKHKERESSVSLGIFVDDQDRPVVGGTVAAGSRRHHPAGFGLMRLTATGRPDTTFAPHGRVSFRFGRVSAAGGIPMPVAPDRILLVGEGERDELHFGVLARVRVAER
jgi:uncharacterized delta-60 repeat protein